MDPSAIAAISMGLSSAQTMQSVNVSMLSKSMDLQQATMNSLVDMMQSVPSFGHKLDTRA